MKLFRSYSTAENNDRYCDNIINTDAQKLDAIKTGFDDESKSFAIQLTITDQLTITEGRVTELHQTIDIARVRIKMILVAWGADPVEASKLSEEMRFLKN